MKSLLKPEFKRSLVDAASTKSGWVNIVPWLGPAISGAGEDTLNTLENLIQLFSNTLSAVWKFIYSVLNKKNNEANSVNIQIAELLPESGQPGAAELVSN